MLSWSLSVTRRRVPAVVLCIAAARSRLGAVALTTVLDPGGFPLLASQTPAQRCAGNNGNGGLRRVDLFEMGSFSVRHSSTTLNPSANPSLQREQRVQPAQLLQNLLAGAATEEQNNASGMPGGASVASEAPLILLNGHVCALSPETLIKVRNGNELGGFQLREPYEWESDDEATGFLLPRWIWGIVAGETGGGGLLMMAAPSTTNHSGSALPSSPHPGRRPEGTTPSAADRQGFEPFVQLATWGYGTFTPLARFTTDLYLGSGSAQPGAGDHQVQGAVRITAGGKRGTIGLASTSLVWTPSLFSARAAAANNPSDVDGCRSSGSSCPPDNTSLLVTDDAAPFLRADAEKLEAEGFSHAIRLSAARSFELAVAGARDGEQGAEEGGHGEQPGEDSRAQADGREKEWRARSSRSGSPAALLRGDSGSLNASAGVTKFEAVDTALLAGVNGVRVASATGDAVLGATGANASVVLEGGSAILGAAPAVFIAAGREGFLSRAIPTDAPDLTAEDGGRSSWAGGGYLDLTAGAARIGGPPSGEGGRGPSIEAGEERVHLRASHSSLLSVSPANISLRTPTVVLLSSSATLLAAHDNDEDDRVSDRMSPPAQESAGPGVEAAPWSTLSLDGGALAINTTESAELEAPGASLRLVGRRCSHGDPGAGATDCGTRGSASGDDVGNGALGESVGQGLRMGELLADADAVVIRARSASAGVSIVADGETSRVKGGEATPAAAADRGRKEGGGSGDGGDDDGDAGGRLQVSAEGVSAEGISTSLGASRHVSLRVGGTQLRKGFKGRGDAAETGTEDGGGSSSVDMGDWGVRVLAGVPAAPSESANGNDSILLRAASRLDLEAHEIAFSNGYGEGGAGGGGGGLWMKESALTGRAKDHVLLEAGESSSLSSSGNSERGKTANSQISMRESLIHIRAGGEEAERASRTAPGGDADAPSADAGRKGLLVEVSGLANVSSTEGLQLQTAGEIRLRSSDETLLQSTRGILLSAAEGGGRAAMGAPQDAAPSGDNSQRGQRSEEGGPILLAPGAGSGVGIGPGFSRRDLAGASGTVPSLLYVTNATANVSGTSVLSESQQSLLPPPDALVAVASSGGGSGVSVLSPRGSTSAVRFGCEELPYSGGLEVYHHRGGRAGDVLMLELASSPGRMVGDALGRWGVGAVPRPSRTEATPKLAAALHVFGTPAAAAAAGAADPVPVAASESPVALLVDAAVGTAGVMQLLSDGEGASYPTPAANAIVLSSSSVQPGRRTHSHWILAQLAGGAESTSRPRWADIQADPSSWAEGMILTHVVSDGGPSGWRPALGMPTSKSSATPPEAGSSGEHHGAARPAVTLGAGGRAGFGTASTGARVTVGGALLAEQVLAFSDEGMVRDVEELGAQGGSQAMEAIRQIAVVRFGWTKEASESYGLELDVRQTGIIAQQVEKEVPAWATGLVRRDAATGRKALSHSRLLVTLVAAFQYLDGSVSAQGLTWDARLRELELASASSEERSLGFSERLSAVESMAAIGLESLLAQTRNVSVMEGRLSEQGRHVDEVAVVLSSVQEGAAQERATTQEWRMDRGRREQELENEVIDLKARLTSLEEQQAASREEQESRQKAQEEQIRALSLRIGSIHASQSSSKCDASLLAELGELRAAHDAIQKRLAGLDQHILHDQDAAFNEEVYFLEEVRRIENQLRDGLLMSAAASATDTVSGAAAVPHPGAERNVDRNSRFVFPAPEDEIREHLEQHKDSVRLEAMAAVQRHRDHLAALRKAVNVL